MNTENIWLFGRRYDLWFFILPGLYLFTFYIPYFYVGIQWVFLLYLIHHVVFSFPHMFFTGTSLHSDLGHRKVTRWPIIVCVLVAIASFFTIFSGAEFLRNFTFGVILWWGIFHIYMQHLGIFKIYQQVQSKRRSDALSKGDLRFFNVMFFLSVNMGLLHALSSPPIEYVLLPELRFKLFSQIIPYGVFRVIFYGTLTALLVLLYRVVWLRSKRGEFIPWPQLLLLLVCSLSNSLPYVLLPDGGLGMALITQTVFHNIQYLGFVWKYEEIKVDLFLEEKLELRGLQRFVQNKQPGVFYLPAFLFGAAMVGLLLWHPKFGFTLYLAVTFSHYLIEGFIWRRKYNRNMPGFVSRILQMKPVSVPYGEGSAL